MKVYYVGPGGCTAGEYASLMAGKHIMYSYATCHGRDVPEKVAGYCLDSGAFSEWKRKRPVNMDRLIRWYEKHDTADFKLMLDVIGGSVAEQKKQSAHHGDERAGRGAGVSRTRLRAVVVVR